MNFQSVVFVKSCQETIITHSLAKGTSTIIKKVNYVSAKDWCRHFQQTNKNNGIDSVNFIKILKSLNGKTSGISSTISLNHI